MQPSEATCAHCGAPIRRVQLGTAAHCLWANGSGSDLSVWCNRQVGGTKHDNEPRETAPTSDGAAQ